MNICFHAKLTGPNVNEYIITKQINVQQNPGRGAKLACPRPKTIPYQQVQEITSDGTSGRKILKIMTRFALGKQYKRF